MTAVASEDGGASADLAVTLETPLPRLPVGRPTAVFCCGTCFHRHRRIVRFELVVDGVRHPTAAAGMPRPDRFREDPGLRSYRSGFWATVPIEARERAGAVEIGVEARLDDGASATAALGRIEIIEANEPPTYEGLPDPGDEPRIAVCMATFDPRNDLFRVQIESLREQTDRNWICLISDDCSAPERYAEIEATLDGDPRFVLSRSERRLGFYRNFERALEMIPAGVELVALCDQDDRWYPDKLETLRAALVGAQLAYSDQRLVAADGRVLRETLWRGRRNNHTNLASLVIANAIAGAASLFRREVIDAALPFPEGPGWQFHDHWLAMVALARGDLAYVDRPLYDYVQHADAVVGKVAVERPEVARPRRPRLRGLLTRWRAAYFRAYLQLDLQARVLEVRCEAELTPRKRRALRLLIAAGRSPLALAWLALRPLRGLVGRNETLAAEALLARGVLWRHLIEIRARGRERPGEARIDASIPPFDVETFGQKRLKRWLANA